MEAIYKLQITIPKEAKKLSKCVHKDKLQTILESIYIDYSTKDIIGCDGHILMIYKANINVLKEAEEDSFCNFYGKPDGLRLPAKLFSGFCGKTIEVEYFDSPQKVEDGVNIRNGFYSLHINGQPMENYTNDKDLYFCAPRCKYLNYFSVIPQTGHKVVLTDMQVSELFSFIDTIKKTVKEKASKYARDTFSIEVNELKEVILTYSDIDYKIELYKKLSGTCETNIAFFVSYDYKRFDIFKSEFSGVFHINFKTENCFNVSRVILLPELKKAYKALLMNVFTIVYSGDWAKDIETGSSVTKGTNI